jgi:ABC-2 type transport system ATP-binding protein
MAIANDHRDGIRLSHLTKSYGEVRAIHGIDVAIAPGETVALLGPNGAGKTTTIDMVLGLTGPDTGAVSVFGSSPADAVKSGAVGGMLQTGSLVQFLSVRELIMMVASPYPHPLEVKDALGLTGTAEFADRPTTRLSGSPAKWM